MKPPLRIAWVTVDNRDETRAYSHPAPSFGTAVSAVLEGMQVRRDCEIHLLCCTQRALAAPTRLAEKIYYHSLLVPKLGWLRTGYQGCVRAVRHKLAELTPALVHGQGTERYCALSAAFSGWPNLVTVHGNMRSIARRQQAKLFSFHWLTARLESITLRRAGGVFCNSGYTEDQVRGIARRCWRVPNALQLEFFSPTPPRTHRTAPPRLLTIGTVVNYKRQLELLHLAEQMHGQGMRFTWDFIGPLGSGPYASRFVEQIGSARRAGYATHLGPLPLPGIIAEMDRSDALVHFPTEEAFGLVVAESLSRNLKLFGVCGGGVREIANGVEGCDLFANDDWDGLAAAIAGWLRSGCPRPRASSQVMHDRYHPTVIAQKHLEIYTEFLNTRR